MSRSERIIEKEELRSYTYDTKEPIKSSDFSSSLNQGYIGEEERFKNLSLSGGSVTNPNVIALHPVGEPSLQTQSNFSSSQYISEPISQQPLVQTFEQPRLVQTFEQPRLIQSEEYIRKPVDTTVLPVEGEVAGTKLSKKEKKKLLLTPEQRQAKNAKLAGLTGAKRDKAIAKRRAKIEKRELKIRTLQDQIAALNVSSWSSRSDVSGIGAVAPAGTGVGYSYSSGVSDYSSGLSSTGVAGSSDLGYAGEAHQAERPGLMTRLKTKMRRNKTPADREAKLARLRNLSGQEREDMLVKKRHKLNLAEEKVRYLREQLALLEGSNLPMSSGMSFGWVSGSSSSLMTGSIGSVAACPHVQPGYNACATCLPTSTMAPVGLGATSVAAPIGLGASSAGLSSGLVSNVEGNMATRDLIASETTATSETNAAGKYGGAHGIGEMLSREKDFNTASRTDAGVIPASHSVAGLAATEPVMSATGVPGAMETVAEGRHGGAHSIREMLSKEKDFPAISRQAEVSGVAPTTATSVNAAEHKPGLIERITEKITGKHHRDTVHP